MSIPDAHRHGLAVDDLDATHAALLDPVETPSDPRATASKTRTLSVRNPGDNPVELQEA